MSFHDLRLTGAGGGKSGSGGYSESPNTLRAKQTLRLLTLVSEGVTGGLVNGAKSIYCDDVPVQNADGSYNFEGVSFETRIGLPDQTPMSGFPAVETEVSVGSEVKQNVSITQAITNLDATAARVSIRLPSLSKTDTGSGSVNGNSVSIAIDCRTEGGTWTVVRTDTISGKCTSPYVRAYRFDLPGTGPWYVRVRRLSEDSNGTTSLNATYWSSFTVIEDYQLVYPDSALLGLVVDASSFGSSSIPTVRADWAGIEIQLPANYDPETRAYAGIWDGTFKRAVSDNPAWIFFDLIDNDRYGLKKYLAGFSVTFPDLYSLTKWELYEIGRYCDELIDDGFGGKEPRFTFNGMISDRDEAINVLTAMAGVFRGVVYWGAGSIMPVCDKPSEARKLVTRANVIDGAFTYQGSSLSARHTQVMVQWFDPENSFKPAIEVVEDPDAIALYGARQTEIQAIGCTSRGQAHRYGTWLLDTEQNETEVVSYRAGLDHADVVPGDVVLIADPSYAGVRFGGRLAGVSEDLRTLTLDAPVTLGEGESYSVTVVMPDGSLADRDVTNMAGETLTLSLASALPAAPIAGALWLMTGSDVAPRPFRVLSVTEAEKHQFDISALVYDETKYARVERGLVLEKPSFSAYPKGPLAAPTNISVREYLYLAGGTTVRGAATIGWTPPADARTERFEVQIKAPDLEWAPAGSTSSASIDVLDLLPGLYRFRVQSVASLGGLRSQWLETPALLIASVNAPPDDVDGFGIAVLGDISTLSWKAVGSLNLSHYLVRYTPSTGGSTWGSAAVLLPHVTSTSVQVPTRPGTHLIKAVSTQGIESLSAALIVSTVEGAARNVVDEITNGPVWAGVHDGTYASGGALRLESVDTLANWSSLEAVKSIAYGINGIRSSGIYTSETVLDLGEIFTSRVTPEIVASGDNLNNTIGSWAHLRDVEGLAGAGSTLWGAVMEIRTTSDDPKADPTWSDWREAATGDVVARAFQRRLVLTSGAPAITPVVSRARLLVDMPDRIVSGNDLAVPAVGLRVVFAPPYKRLTGLSVSAQGMAPGDYYELTDKGEGGFSIAFRDASGAAVARTFDYVAAGYGQLRT